MTSLAEAASLAPTSAARPAAASHRVEADMNRAERIGFWLYVGTGMSSLTVLVAAVTTAIAS